MLCECWTRPANGWGEHVVRVVDLLADRAVVLLAQPLGRPRRPHGSRPVTSWAAIAARLCTEAERVSSIANRPKLTSDDRAGDDRDVAQGALEHGDRIGRSMTARESPDRRTAYARPRFIGRGDADQRAPSRSTTSTPSGRSCARRLPRAGHARGRARARAGRDRGRRDDDGRGPGRLRRAGRRRGRQGVLRAQGVQAARAFSAGSRGRCWSPSDRCLVVEDVVTTGGSTLRAIEALQEEGTHDRRRRSRCWTASRAAASGSRRPRARPTSRSRRLMRSFPSAPIAQLDRASPS